MDRRPFQEFAHRLRAFADAVENPQTTITELAHAAHACGLTLRLGFIDNGQRAALAEFLRQEQRDASEHARMWRDDAMTIVRCDDFTREECLVRAERHELRAKRFGEIAERLVALGQPVHAQD